MNAIALGPLLISLPRLFAVGCALLLLLASRFFLALPARDKSRWFNGLILAWLVGARLSYVALNASSYAGEPLEVLKFWQPGYHPLGGFLAGLLWSAWYLRENLKPMAVAMALFAGASGLWLLTLMFTVSNSNFAVAELPEIALEDLDGNEVYLPDLTATGDLILINLWATWCPPCLREMPLLQQADAQQGVSVVIVNQGEDLLPVVRYLDEQALAFQYALRDPDQTLMERFEAPGLPTTLLFGPDGRTRDVHVGELTRAQLERWLND
ncbi:prolipoprotein diacylglyceryl transferase family protein [Vreelandella sp. EE22]